MADPTALHVHVHSDRVASVLTESGKQVAYCRGVDAVANAEMFALSPKLRGALRPFADAWRTRTFPIVDFAPYQWAAELLDRLEA